MNSITKSDVLLKDEPRPFDCKECATEKEKIVCEIAQTVFLKTSQLSNIFPKDSRIINEGAVEVVIIAQACQEKLTKEDLSDLEKKTCTEILKNITEIIVARDTKLDESEKKIEGYLLMLKVVGVGTASLALIALAHDLHFF